MTDFKKGGPLQNSNIYATNRLFVKNPLFKKRKKKRAPGVYNPKAKFKYEDGGENKTKLTKEEEKQFQKFYKTLPENLQIDDDIYDIRGYWDAEGRPETFNYDQPTDNQGYYNAYSINPNTGEYLKSPAHDTFQHAVDEDRKIGYRPLTNVYGRNIAVENESIADPEAQTFLRNTQGPVSYKSGGEKGCPPGQQWNPYTKRCEPKLEDRTFLNLMRDRKYGALQQFKLAPKSSYNPKYIQNLKEVTITASKKAKAKKNKKKTDTFSSDYEKLVEQYDKLKNSPLLANQEQANNLLNQIKDIELYNPGSTRKNLYRGERLEDEINNLLDKAQDKASISANAITEDGNDEIDNFRHPQAGRYAAEAIVNYFPEWAQYTGIPQIAGFLGANAMGVAHEIGTLPHDERSWSTKLAESGEDIFNNAVGAGVGVLPMNSRDKTNALLELSKQNMLPDGIVDENPANNLYLKKGPNDPGKFKSPYKQELGGSIMDLTEEEIQKYIDGGYVVEEVNDPSIPALTKAAKGGTKKGCPEGQYWDGVKCTKLITLKNDKKYIDGVANWAMHTSDPNMISGDYNDQIKERLYSGKWGFDPESGALVRLSAVQPKSVTTLDAKTKAAREKEKKEQTAQRIKWDSQDTYRQSIIDAGFDPATFGKAKGINTITGEPIYASSKEEADRINQEAINQFAIEGHAAVVNNPVFKAGAYMTPVGMAIGAMEGLARFIPDATTLAQDPTLANAGQLGMDALQALPFAKPIANTVKSAVQNTYKINPWAFKPNPEAYYHRSPKLENIINKEENILQGFAKSDEGVAYSKNRLQANGEYLRPANEQLYFSKGVPLDKGRYNTAKNAAKEHVDVNYPGPYIVEIEGVPMGASVSGRIPASNAPTKLGDYAVPHRPIALDEAKFYKEHWLKGYVPVDKSKVIANIPDKVIPNKVVIPDTAIGVPEYQWKQMSDIHKKAFQEKYGDSLHIMPDEEYSAWSQKPEVQMNMRNRAMQEQASRNNPSSTNGLQQQQYGGALKRFIDGGEEDCPKGYMRSYDGKCVPSIDPEQVDADEWYRNWYANRVIQDEQGQKLLNEARPKILKRAEKFPETTWYSEPGSSTHGSFEPLTGEIRLNSALLDNNPFLKNQIKFHEKGHYLTSANMMDPEADTAAEVLAHPIQQLKNYEADIVNQALKKRKDVPRKDRKYYDYLKGKGKAKPYTEEISKNLMELRLRAGFKPDQVITEEDINNLYKKADEKGWTDPNSDFFIEPFLNLKNYTKDTEQLKTLFNKLAKNEPEQVDEFQPQVSRYGGSKNKYIELDIPEEEIQWYIDNGYIVERVSKLKKFIQGGTLSDMWYQYTGTPWSEAKAKGLTDGSFEQNLALAKRLEAGEFGEPKIVDTKPTPTVTSYDKMVFALVKQGNSLDDLVKQKIGTREGLIFKYPELFANKKNVSAPKKSGPKPKKGTTIMEQFDALSKFASPYIDKVGDAVSTAYDSWINRMSKISEQEKKAEQLKKFTKPTGNQKQVIQPYDIEALKAQLTQSNAAGAPPSLTRQPSQQPLGNNSFAAQFAEYGQRGQGIEMNPLKNVTDNNVTLPVINNKTKEEPFSNQRFATPDIEKEIFTRQEQDNMKYGKFMGRGKNIANRTDVQRNVDSEKFFADIASPNSVIIDIGSALGNTDPKLAGVSVWELTQNPKIKQKKIKVIATDIPEQVNTFKQHSKDKKAYNIDYAEVPMTFNTPVDTILKSKNLTNTKDIYLRAANSIDLLMTPIQTKEHFDYIAKTLKNKNVTYVFNNIILFKPAGKSTFTKLGNINNAAYDHNAASWTVNKDRKPYKLLGKE